MSQKLKDPNLSWNTFIQSTTCHGVKYIFDPTPSKLRRFLWIGCVLLSLGLFMGQVLSRAMDYLKYESNVNVAVIYPEESIPFPAVTICNQNSFRMTKAISAGLYNFLDDVYSRTKTTETNFDQYPINSTDAKKFLTEVAHQKEDLIDVCLWQGQPCNMDDFKMVNTDLGICYTFNGEPDKLLRVKESGTLHGLTLVMNIEQYEYMKGPQNDAGISILLHNQSEVAQMKDLGFSVRPGMHTTSGIERTEVLSLPLPYGSCYPDSEPKSVCESKCFKKLVVEVCQCVPLNFGNSSSDYKNNSAIKPCNIEDHFTCVKNQSSEFGSYRNKCKCTIPCEKTSYKPNLSYAMLSKFNVERMVHQGLTKKEKVRESFLNARDLSQKYVQQYILKDNKEMSDVLRIIGQLQSLMEQFEKEILPSMEIAKMHKTVDILSMGADIMKIDLSYDIILKERINYLRLLSYQFTYGGMFKDIFSSLHSVRFWDLEVTFMRGFLQMYPVNNNVSVLYSDLQTLKNSIDQKFIDEAKNTNESYPNSSNTEEKYTYEFERITRYALYRISKYKDLMEKTDFEDIPFKIEKWYHRAIQYVFGNISNDFSDNYPEHEYCLMALRDLLLKENLANIADIFGFIKKWTNLTKSNGTIVEKLDSLLNLTDKIIKSVGSKGLIKTFHIIEGVSEKCSWMNMKDFDASKSRRLDIRLDLGKAFKDLMISSQTLYEECTYLTKLTNVTLGFIRNNLYNYQHGNLTKSILASNLRSAHLPRRLTELQDISEEWTTLALEHLKNVLMTKGHMISNYQAYFDFKLPLIGEREIEKLELIKRLQSLENSSGLNEKLTKLLEMLPKDVPNNLKNIIEAIFEPWVLFEENLLRFSMLYTKKLPLKIYKLLTSVGQFVEGNKMEEEFCLENFMTVDIYYRELSYMKIEQQISFRLLSLFSEIGGFLGLLLGASVLTLCELLDYLVLVLTTRVKRNKTDVLTPGEV